MNKNGPLGLVFVAQFADMVHLYPYPREPIIMSPTFGYRFLMSAKLSATKVNIIY